MVLRLKPLNFSFDEFNARNSKNPNMAYSIKWEILSECGNKGGIIRGGRDIDEKVKINAANTITGSQYFKKVLVFIS